MEDRQAALFVSALEPCRTYASLAVARNAGFFLIAVATVPALAALGPWAPLAAVPLLGLSMYRLTLVMHDCIHGTLFRSARANRVCGIVMGALSGIEFRAFARLHWLHHRMAGRPDDPQGPDYLSLPPSPAGILWHLLRPLLGYNIFKLWQVIRVLDGSATQRVGRRGLLVVIAAQGLAALVASNGLADWWLAPLPIVSAATFGLFFAQLRGFAEHAALPGQNPEGCVRSHRPAAIDRILLYDLNFNYHREHHLYPNAPSCHLPEVHRRLALRDPRAFALAPGMFESVWSRVIAVDPGRGASARSDR